MNKLSADLDKHLEDKVIILGRTSEGYYTDTCKLDFLMGRLSSQPSSEVIDLATRKSGLDFFLIEYNDMVRSLRKYGVEWTLEHNELARNFSKGRGLVDGIGK